MKENKWYSLALITLLFRRPTLQTINKWSKTPNFTFQGNFIRLFHLHKETIDKDCKGSYMVQVDPKI